jgi:hypothetical protein
MEGDSPATTTQENDEVPSQNPQGKWMVDLFSGLGKVLNQVGIGGFIVLSIVIFVYLFSDQHRKDEIIDAWLLFKTGLAQFYIILFVLIIILLAQQIHYKRVIAMKDDRIRELAGRKNSEYKKQLGQKLSSSQFKRKR